MLSTKISVETNTSSLIGDDSSRNPYEITTLGNLHWIAEDNTKYNKHYNKIPNTDASNTSNQEIYKNIWRNR